MLKAAWARARGISAAVNGWGRKQQRAEWPTAARKDT